MALVGGAAAPPLRHAHSESRLHARQRAGSAVLGMPGLNSCSSAADCGLQHVDKRVLAAKAVADSAAKGLLAALSAKPGAKENTIDAFAKHRFKQSDEGKDCLSCLQDRSVSGPKAAPQVLAAGTGNESRATLPPLAEVGRGSVRLGSPLQNALRPAKRSRSTSGLHSAQTQEERHSPQTSPLQTRSKSGLLPELPHSRSDIDLEQVLVTALDGKSGVHKAPLKQCSLETEAHLEKLMHLLDGEENKNSFPGKKSRRRASILDSHGDNENGIFRKGTGFVHLGSPLEKSRGHRARINDDHGDNENGINRKGTGFVHLSSVEKAEDRHARIVDDHGDNENNLRRKGTGFVHLSSSSKKDKERRARINDHHGDNENGIQRQGTGFVNLSSVPKASPSVSFPDSVDENVNHIQRQGTGFVFLKHVEPRVRIVDSHGDNENRLQRKGTGFVDLKAHDYDLLPSSPGSCSTRTVDSRGPCQDGSDTDVASDECDIADASEEQMSVTELD